MTLQMPWREIISASVSDFRRKGLRAPHYRRTRQLVNVQVHNPSLVHISLENRAEFLSTRFITEIKWRTYNESHEVTSKYKVESYLMFVFPAKAAKVKFLRRTIRVRILVSLYLWIRCHLHNTQRHMDHFNFKLKKKVLVAFQFLCLTAHLIFSYHSFAELIPSRAVCSAETRRNQLESKDVKYLRLLLENVKIKFSISGWHTRFFLSLNTFLICRNSIYDGMELWNHLSLVDVSTHTSCGISPNNYCDRKLEKFVVQKTDCLTWFFKIYI